MHQLGKLRIALLAFTLTGCFGGGSSSVVVTSTDRTLDSGTTLTYSSSNATALADTSEFQYFNYSSAASTQNPLEVINAHKAHGYGLTGSGETIAIIDAGFSISHNELDSKTITQYGTQTAATGVNASADHGLIVSSVATGEDDGSGMQGVAPAANLHWASYDQRNGNTYYPTHWANATDNASSAVVQNNSWGIDYQIDSLQSDITSNGWSNTYGIGQKFNSSGLTANESSASSYITALNNFQDHGVIVYALSNTTSFTDADFQSALPELFSQLEEAWITAVNVEITGSSGNETYTRKSAPCGSTAKYCLGADGYQIVGAAYDSSNTSSYWAGVSGTSFVAPQISGAVALLAEAFPNHTPAQLTDRLLASADNSFFSHDAAVTFGNGVEHGYDDEFGHGIMDIYAALNPITSSAYTRIYTGDSTNGDDSYHLQNSKLLTSSALGNSVLRGLVGENGYTYDDLGGGFKYDMSYHINRLKNTSSKIDLVSELNSLSKISSFNHANRNSSAKLNASISIGSNPLPIDDFYDSAISSIDLAEYETSYLSSDSAGIGVGASYRLSDALLSFGAAMPIENHSGQVLGSNKTLVSSIAYGDPQKGSISLMAGLTREEGTLLGSKGFNAFSLSGAETTTKFSTLKVQKQLLDKLSLVGLVSVARSDMTSPNNSFVGPATDVKSSSLALLASVKDFTDSDEFTLFVSQPNRVSDGSLAIKLPSLADHSRNISYSTKNVDLEPNGRQLNYGFSYKKDLKDDLTLALKHTIASNKNHSIDSKIVHSSYLGMAYKDIKLGFVTSPDNPKLDAELTYSYSF
jgi:subtilisin family serine protease